MSHYAIRDEIQRLDPVKDHQRIVFLSSCYDFPFDTTRALEFALFRTFCVPSISGLLDRTGEFGNRAQKRYDDTDIIISELLEWGYESDRGRRAIQRLNELHGRFSIAKSPTRYNERRGDGGCNRIGSRYRTTSVRKSAESERHGARIGLRRGSQCEHRDDARKRRLDRHSARDRQRGDESGLGEHQCDDTREHRRPH